MSRNHAHGRSTRASLNDLTGAVAQCQLLQTVLPQAQRLSRHRRVERPPSPDAARAVRCGATHAADRCVAEPVFYEIEPTGANCAARARFHANSRPVWPTPHRAAFCRSAAPKRRQACSAALPSPKALEGPPFRPPATARATNGREYESLGFSPMHLLSGARLSDGGAQGCSARLLFDPNRTGPSLGARRHPDGGRCMTRARGCERCRASVAVG